MDSYSETLERIYNLRGGMIDLRLDRMERALALFDHPEKIFPSLHIAGTNGKGSTSAMLHRMLSLAGYRTALYTSPHLVSFTERMRIGDCEISQNDVVTLADEVRRRTEAAGVPLTFFEFVTVMAFVLLCPPAGRNRGHRSRFGRAARCHEPCQSLGFADHDDLERSPSVSRTR
jgi:dihydrofolate synthase/folylpolyglutamate synthase